MADRPVSVLTVQSEAPPPYSEYDDLSASAPEPNAETQAMLRDGYRVNSAPVTPQRSLQDESPAAVYLRNRRYTTRHDDLITIARAIHPTIKVDGIPFPTEYPTVSARDVKPEDWKFFATSIVDELEVPAPKGSVPTPLSLNEFRERQLSIDAVVDQWNRGFFGPRGIHLVPAYSYGRAPSPTPTYRTAETGVSEAAEIETVTFDTSPRSTRVPTPDTIREFELERENGGRTTPQAERASFVPTITAFPDENSQHQSALEKEFQEQLRIDESLRQQRLAQAGLANAPARKPVPEPTYHTSGEKHRRLSASSSSSSTTSISTISSSDDIALGDIPAIRRTLAEEFRRDPKDMTHMKAALAQIRDDIKYQHTQLAATTNKLQRKSIQAANKEHRKAMRTEMKELRREMKSYHKIARIHKKDEREAKKAQRKQTREEYKAHRKEAKESRRSGKKLGKERQKHGASSSRGVASELNLVPRASNRTNAGREDWMDAVPGSSASWPFGTKPSGLPDEEIPAEAVASMPPGWPFGGELPGWPWSERPGTAKEKYPPGWPLEVKSAGGPLDEKPRGWPLGEKPPGWPLNKSQTAPAVIRKPVPPPRPDTAPSSPANTGGPGPSNAPPAPPANPPNPALHPGLLTPTHSSPAASAARAASRTPSPGPAPAPCPTSASQVIKSWGGRGRRGRPGADGSGGGGWGGGWGGGRPGADGSGGRGWAGRGRGGRPGADGSGGRGWAGRNISGSEDDLGTGLGGRGRGLGWQRGRDRSHSDDGRGRGFGRGRSGSDDHGLLGVARDYLIQGASASFERLRPSPDMGHGPAQRAGSSQSYGPSRGSGDDGQETGVAHK